MYCEVVIKLIVSKTEVKQFIVDNNICERWKRNG